MCIVRVRARCARATCTSDNLSCTMLFAQISHAANDRRESHYDITIIKQII